MSVSLRIHLTVLHRATVTLVLAALLAVAAAGPAWAQRASASDRTTPESRKAPSDGDFRFGPLRLAPEARLESEWRDTASAAGTHHDASGLTSTRLGIKGRIGRRLAFEVSGDPTDTSPWRDVKMSYSLPGSLVATGGQFKVPFGLDAHRNAFERPLVYQSRLGDAYGLGRDQGVSLEWRTWRKRLTVEAGSFVHSAGPAAEDRPSLGFRTGTTTVRVAASPFGRSRGPLASLAIGVGLTRGAISEAPSTLTLQTTANEDLTRPTYWANGTRRRLGLDLEAQPGPLTLAAELIHIEDTRRGQGNGDEDLRPLGGDGWSFEGAWLLTGESSRKFKGPRRSVFAGGPGALALVARVEQARLGHPGVAWLDASSPRATAPAMSQLHAVTAGVNWYPVGKSRLQFNLIHERLLGATTAAARAPRQTTAVIRFQLYL